MCGIEANGHTNKGKNYKGLSYDTYIHIWYEVLSKHVLHLNQT